MLRIEARILPVTASVAGGQELPYRLRTGRDNTVGISMFGATSPSALNARIERHHGASRAGVEGGRVKRSVPALHGNDVPPLKAAETVDVLYNDIKRSARLRRMSNEDCAEIPRREIRARDCR
jgi:hypothetical protein